MNHKETFAAVAFGLAAATVVPGCDERVYQKSWMEANAQTAVACKPNEGPVFAKLDPLIVDKDELVREKAVANICEDTKNSFVSCAGASRYGVGRKFETINIQCSEPKASQEAAMKKIIHFNGTLVCATNSTVSCD